MSDYRFNIGPAFVFVGIVISLFFMLVFWVYSLFPCKHVSDTPIEPAKELVIKDGVVDTVYIYKF